MAEALEQEQRIVVTEELELRHLAAMQHIAQMALGDSRLAQDVDTMFDLFSIITYHAPQDHQIEAQPIDFRGMSREVPLYIDMFNSVTQTWIRLPRNSDAYEDAVTEQRDGLLFRGNKVEYTRHAEAHPTEPPSHQFYVYDTARQFRANVSRSARFYLIEADNQSNNV